VLLLHGHNRRTLNKTIIIIMLFLLHFISSSSVDELINKS